MLFCLHKFDNMYINGYIHTTGNRCFNQIKIASLNLSKFRSSFFIAGVSSLNSLRPSYHIEFCVYVFLLVGNLKSSLFLKILVVASLLYVISSFIYSGTKLFLILKIIISVLKFTSCLVEWKSNISSIHLICVFLAFFRIMRIARFCNSCREGISPSFAMKMIEE
jgi:hypothetical protein